MTTLTKAQARTMRAAGDARATGQLSKTAYKSIADGKVTKNDLQKARKLLTNAKSLLRDISREGASARQLKLAEREVKIADTLCGAIDDQLDAQERDGTSARTPSRPRTSGGKGSTRRTTTRAPRRTVRRPRVSSGKGGGVRPSGK